MKLKLIQSNNETQSQSVDKFLEKVKKDNFYYFHRETSYKNLMDLQEQLEEKGFSVYFREVKFGLDEQDYMYELHTL